MQINITTTELVWVGEVLVTLEYASANVTGSESQIKEKNLLQGTLLHYKRVALHLKCYFQQSILLPLH